MLSRLAIASAVLLLFVCLPASAAKRDYLQRGEERLTAEYEIKYERAVRYVLSRGWRRDVVVRMSVTPAFQPEFVTGIARTPNGYMAFKATVAKNIWYELGFGSEEWKRKHKNFRGIKPILNERPLSEALSVRIAALWRRVLTDPRNYGKDVNMYLDTDQFTYYVGFLPNERSSAYMVAWGPQSEQLIAVASLVASYASGAPEPELVKEVAKAERKLGI